MEKIYSILDEKDFLLYSQSFIEGEQPTNAVDLVYKGSFITAKYDRENNVFVEGASAIELEAGHLIQFTDLYNSIFSKISLYVKAMALGKTIADDLDYYELAYTNKYHEAVALKVKVDNSDVIPADNKLLIESQIEEYATLIDYLNVIITAYSQGLGFRNAAIDMTEVMRKRVLLDKKDGNFELGVRRMKLVADLPPGTTPQQVEIIFNQIMTLE